MNRGPHEVTLNEGGLNAIRAEARRMQERVTFEKEIRLAMERQREEMTEHADPGPEEDVEDPDEWWRLLQDIMLG